MKNEAKTHYSAEDVCTYLFKVTPAKSVICSKGETSDEIDISFTMPSFIPNTIEVLNFVYSSSNLSLSINCSSTSVNTKYTIKVDTSLPF